MYFTRKTLRHVYNVFAIRGVNEERAELEIFSFIMFLNIYPFYKFKKSAITNLKTGFVPTNSENKGVHTFHDKVHFCAKYIYCL